MTTAEMVADAHDRADTEARQSPLAAAADSLQLVSFHLGGETYGIEIKKIREIILVGKITRIPESPPSIKGLINLRNRVIPVIDLRARFGLAEEEFTSDSRIMVLSVGDQTLGIIVDAVSEVLRVRGDEICPSPAVTSDPANAYMTGLVRLEEALLILLDVDRLFGHDEREALAELSS